ncbi:regulation of nuclear pre-mRNA domain-containing protein 1A-like [Tachypleus tridentatus]|uniref:regulation of nuclear pre-mRNA domain-containing protein 1A-like n=1 Tax=Tachypleus tridentatus TaxID=6853 RepID=UPI003FCFB682
MVLLTDETRLFDSNRFIYGREEKSIPFTKPSHRLTLLYLANDVVQNSQKKAGSHFGESFAEVLKEACVLLRDEKIQTSVKRVFKIWEERSVYDPDFINELYDMLEGSKESPPVSSKIIADFKVRKENFISLFSLFYNIFAVYSV